MRGWLFAAFVCFWWVAYGVSAEMPWLYIAAGVIITGTVVALALIFFGRDKQAE